MSAGKNFFNFRNCLILAIVGVIGGIIIWNIIKIFVPLPSPYLIFVAKITEKAHQSPTPSSGVSPTAATSQPTTTPSIGKGVPEEGLIGEWQSDCLVPDQDSDWSEKHYYKIAEDGRATYIRWSSGDHVCTPETTVTHDFILTFPQKGQVNFTEDGKTWYDIYQLDGDTLRFGWGFQANYPPGYDATQGDSGSHRFYILNNYIALKRK